MLRASIGSLVLLGLKDIKMDAYPTTLYFMVGERCTYSCSYCAQGRNSTADTRKLSRVIWPEVSLDDALKGIKTIEEKLKNKNGILPKRICFQVTTTKNSMLFLKTVIKAIKEVSSLPISVSYRFRNLDEAKEIFSFGVEKIGSALDIASDEIFKALRGGSLSSDLELLKALNQNFVGRVTTHLIIGMGESEMDASELLIDLARNNIPVSLFAFTPIKGTELEGKMPPSLFYYRKIQFLTALLKRKENFYIEYGQNKKIIGFGLPKNKVRKIIEEDFPFKTSGCPGCNRPFYNESPQGPIYNYPLLPALTVIREEAEEFIKGLENINPNFSKPAINQAQKYYEIKRYFNLQDPLENG